MSKFGDESDTYAVTIKMETRDAFLVTDGEDSDATEARLPKSQIEYPSEAAVGWTGDIEVPNWLADAKGLLG